MSPQTNNIGSIKTKWSPKLKKEKTGAATCNDFLLKYLTLNAALKIRISSCHYIVLIGIISNGNPYEWTLIMNSYTLVHWVKFGINIVLERDLKI